MSDLPPASTPAAGWYPDPAEPSVLRYWDGVQWTSHMQPAPLPATELPASRLSNKTALGIVLALGVVVTLLFVVLSGGDDEGDAVADSFSEQQALSLDAEAKAEVRTAQTAVETYATDNDGLYAGATADELRLIESTLTDVDMSVTAEDEAYTVSVTSETGSSFGISRDANGQVTYSCDPLGTGGCPASGDWTAE